MLKPEQVPEDVWVQVALRFESAGCMIDNDTAKQFAAEFINAWPGMHTHEWQRPWLGGMSGTDLILPLPTEASDD